MVEDVHLVVAPMSKGAMQVILVTAWCWLLNSFLLIRPLDVGRSVGKDIADRARTSPQKLAESLIIR
jgi:hypothetical protein